MKGILDMLKIIFLSSLGFALFGGLISLLLYFGDFKRIGFIFTLGLFVGLIAAPEFEPKVFKHPVMFQTLGGLFFGVTLGFFLNYDMKNIIIVSLVGALLGATASFWLKHFNFP